MMIGLIGPYIHTWTLDDRGVALAKLFRYLSAKVSATGSLRSMVTLVMVQLFMVHA